MATAVGIMDRDDWRARTDVLGVVDPGPKEVTWVPRDLWCENLRNRINVAFARGGHDLLVEALAVHGFRIQHTLVLRRLAVERALEDVTTTVPVGKPLRFWYPLHPHTLLKDGKKPVDFDPPAARLSGERIHQWMGARTTRDGGSSDYARMQRQQTLLVALLAQGFDFSRMLQDPERVRVSHPQALDELKRVDGSWSFRLLTGLVGRRIDGKAVLVPKD